MFCVIDDHQGYCDNLCGDNRESKNSSSPIPKKFMCPIFGSSYFVVFIFAFWSWVSNITKVWTKVAKISRYMVIISGLHTVKTLSN